MIMYWRHFKILIPENGKSCIVKRRSGKNFKYCLCTFYHFGSEYVWETKQHSSFKCEINDAWCPVEDIITNVENRLFSEIRNALDD